MSSLRRYLLGLLTAAVTIAAAEFLTPFLSGHYLFLFIIAVVVSSLYCGFGVGLITTILLTFSHNYFFQTPRHSLEVANPNDWLELGLFLIISILMSWIGSSMRSNRRAAEEAVKARENLIAIVSHDLKNPLTSIRLNSDMIIGVRAETQNEVNMQKRAKRIGSAVEQMNKLIHGILDCEKIQGNTLDIEPKRESIKSILSDVNILIEPLAQQKSLDFQVDSLMEDFDVVCDRERILQVLSNLLGNSVKFTPQKGKVALKITQSEKEVSFSVKDSGPGISKNNLPHVFDRYWQAKATANQGSGLGLSIAKGIVEAHHGKIEVKSDVGHGTTFTFKIPKNQMVN